MKSAGYLARAGAPAEVYLKLRMPKENAVKSATVNGRPATLGGEHGDTVIIKTGTARRCDVVGSYQRAEIGPDM